MSACQGGEAAEEGTSTAAALASLLAERVDLLEPNRVDKEVVSSRVPTSYLGLARWLCFSSAGELLDGASIVPGAGFKAELESGKAGGVTVDVSSNKRPGQFLGG